MKVSRPEEAMKYIDIAVGDTDFARYHPLEHSLTACSDLVTHVRLWWSYRGEEAATGVIIGVPWRLVMCALNKHWWLPTLDLRLNVHGNVCAWCEARA
jgi:hypothetical protein